jgi:hypothetical protein
MHSQDKTEDTYRQSPSLNEETAVMAEIGRLISSAFKIEDVYGQLAAEVKKLISFDRLAVIFINHREGTYTLSYEAGFDIPERKMGRMAIKNPLFLAGSGLPRTCSDCHLAERGGFEPP